MKIDICIIYKPLVFSNILYPPMLDTLKMWSRGVGWKADTKTCSEKEIDLDTDADVVAFCVYTKNANSTYRVAGKLREKGKIVIMGGPHLRGPNCQEAFPYCDVAVHSIHEGQWFEILKKIESGDIEPNSKKTYYVEDSKNLFRLPDNLYEAYAEHPPFHFPSILTSLGCPYSCDFCNGYRSNDYMVRNVESIYKEVSQVKGKLVGFLDASFGMNRKHTIELMEALTPLNKTFMAELPLSRIHDTELLDTMSKAGMKFLDVGIESFSTQLKKHGKTSSNITDSLNSAIRKAHDRGILFGGGVIAGMDNDGLESFDYIYEFYKKSAIDIIYLDILTPYPNTELYYNFKENGRLVDDNWDHYDYHHVVFQPKNMTVTQLINGFNRLYGRLTQTETILKKSLRTFETVGVNALTLFGGLYQFYHKFDAAKKGRDLIKQRKNLDT